MVFREWALANMVLSLAVLPIGLIALCSAVMLFANYRKGGSLFRVSVWMSPLFVAEALYYSWVLDGSTVRALAYALFGLLGFLLWAWVLDRGTRGSSQRDRPPMQ